MGKFPKYFFQLWRGCPQQDDIPGGTMPVGEAAAPSLPQLAQLSQVFSLIIITGRLNDAEGMKIFCRRKLFRLVTVSTNNTTTIPKNTCDTTVFPVSLLLLIGEFQNIEEIITNLLRYLQINVGFFSRLGLL